MGFELCDGAFFVMGSDGERFELGNGNIEIDALSPDETPSIMACAKSALSVSHEMSMQDINWISGLICNQFAPTKTFDIEYDTPI